MDGGWGDKPVCVSSLKSQQKEVGLGAAGSLLPNIRRKVIWMEGAVLLLLFYRMFCSQWGMGGTQEAGTNSRRTSWEFGRWIL